MSDAPQDLLREREILVPTKHGRVRNHRPARVMFMQCMETGGRRRVARAVVIMLRWEMQCEIGVTENDHGCHICKGEH